MEDFHTPLSSIDALISVVFTAQELILLQLGSLVTNFRIFFMTTIISYTVALLAAAGLVLFQEQECQI